MNETLLDVKLQKQKMDILIKTPFFQAVSAASEEKEFNYQELYKGFTYKILELCNATDMNFTDMIFTLHHTNIELTALQEITEEKNTETLLYIKKAVLFTQTGIDYLNSSQSLENRSSEKPAVVHSKIKKWSAKIIHLVEIVYALDTMKCVDDGDGTLEELSAYISRHWGVEIKNCFNAYVDIKKRKGESRTYFLDELSRRLNERMRQDDEKYLSLSGK